MQITGIELNACCGIHSTVLPCSTSASTGTATRPPSAKTGVLHDDTYLLVRHLASQRFEDGFEEAAANAPRRGLDRTIDAGRYPGLDRRGAFFADVVFEVAERSLLRHTKRFGDLDRRSAAVEVGVGGAAGLLG